VARFSIGRMTLAIITVVVAASVTNGIVGVAQAAGPGGPVQLAGLAGHANIALTKVNRSSIQNFDPKRPGFSKATSVPRVEKATSNTGSRVAATLTGTVGPGFTIALKKGSTKVTSLTTGTYTIVVNDRSSMHNFHLKGPGFNKATSVPGVGRTKWTAHLRVGTYTYVCDPHASMMRGSFGVH